MRKLTLDEVSLEFRLSGLEFLDECYKNASFSHNFKCLICGHIGKTCLGNVKSGRRCGKCSGNKKYTYDEVKSIFISKGYTLLSTTYVGSHEQLDCICKCGSATKTTLHNIINGHNCYTCGLKKLSDKSLKHGKCSIYTGYKVTNPQIIKYDSRHYTFRCNCGNIETRRTNITLVKKDSIYYCFTCRVKRQWVNSLGRGSLKYKAWRTDVFKRDNYKCVYCSSKNIQSHHIHSWSKHESLRFAITNGITLCENCHIKLHSLHGKSVSHEDLSMFLRKNIPIRLLQPGDRVRTIFNDELYYLNDPMVDPINTLVSSSFIKETSSHIPWPHQIIDYVSSKKNMNRSLVLRALIVLDKTNSELSFDELCQLFLAEEEENTSVSFFLSQ